MVPPAFHVICVLCVAKQTPFTVLSPALGIQVKRLMKKKTTSRWNAILDLHTLGFKGSTDVFFFGDLQSPPGTWDPMDS